MGTVRPAAVAGTFYPAEPAALRRTITDLLDAASPPLIDVTPRMVIVPHAGYVYSGPVAAFAYRLLVASPANRVVLVGPAHFVTFSGMAIPGVDALETPLGGVPIDPALTAAAEADPDVTRNDPAHRDEHSLEVQLPFLQTVLPSFTVLAMLTATVRPERVAEVLDGLLDEENVIAVVSSDLSHYLTYRAARVRDAATIAAIGELRAEDLAWEDACGRTGVQAALLVARRRRWVCRLLDQRNSGDTAGGKSRVVGYAAFAVGPPA
jgi:AmmeMemoRadiSam system protein B